MWFVSHPFPLRCPRWNIQCWGDFPEHRCTRSALSRGETHKILGKPSSDECSWKKFGHQLATDLMSGGSVNGCKKRVREGETSGARALWGEAIKKPVLNYRSSFHPNTEVNTLRIWISFKMDEMPEVPLNWWYMDHAYCNILSSGHDNSSKMHNNIALTNQV